MHRVHAKKLPATNMERRLHRIQKRNLVRHKMEHRNMDNGPSFPFLPCDRKFVISRHLSQLKHIHQCKTLQVQDVQKAVHTQVLSQGDVQARRGSQFAIFQGGIFTLS